MRLCVVVGLGLLLGARPAAAKAAELPPIQLVGGVTVEPCGVETPKDHAAVFTADVSCLRSTVQLEHVYGPHNLRFMYYDPDGNLYVTTKQDWSFGPKRKSSYHRYAWVGHSLPVAGEQSSLLVGTWRVAVWLDDALLAEQSFRLQRPALPEEPGLGEGRDLYMGLQYERAIERLNAMLPGLKNDGAVAECSWWLALSQYSAGQQAPARDTLRRLLTAEPTYAVSPESAKEAGAQEVRTILEELRSTSYPELYRKTSSPPELKLSKAEKPPVVRKRWGLGRKLAVYVGIPLAAVAGVAALVALGVERQLADPPTAYLFTGEAARDPRLGNLCEGHVPIQVSVLTGRAPFEAIFTLQRVGGLREARVQGLEGDLPQVETVVFTESFEGAGSYVADYPAIDVQGEGEGTSNLAFSVVIKDADSTISFVGATPGQPLPGSVLKGLEGSQLGSRIYRASLFDVVTSSCAQPSSSGASRGIRGRGRTSRHGRPR